MIYECNTRVISKKVIVCRSHLVKGNSSFNQVIEELDQFILELTWCHPRLAPRTLRKGVSLMNLARKQVRITQKLSIYSEMGFPRQDETMVCFC